jgi:hypothetical protein
MKIKILLLLSFTLALFNSVEKVELDAHLTIEWEVLNPSQPIDQQLIKFKLILEGATGWASVGWRLKPQNYVWGMAHCDYVVCYLDPNENMNCFDGYMGFKDEPTADGREWNDYLPRPIPDSHSAVGGTEDITFIPTESFRHIADDDKSVTQWVFTRKVLTGDSTDAELDKRGIPSIYAYTMERAIWERDPEYWELDNIGAYHNQERGHFLFFLSQDHAGTNSEL